MEIELYYDPAIPRIRSVINGRVTNPQDIYGFLYPVRNSLLQAWLYPTGSWPGLQRQLEELARGEWLHLVFYGRFVDYEDVARCLQGMNTITLTHCEQVSGQDHAAAVAGVRNLLDEKILVEVDGKQEKYQQFREIFPELTGRIEKILNRTEDSWLCIIRNEEDLRTVTRQQNCCLVAAEFLHSYEQVRKLEKLTRSMRRSGEMIICQLGSREEAKDFQAFCERPGNCAFRFVSADDNGWKDYLRDKYGEPLVFRQQIDAVQHAMELLQDCLRQKSEVDERVRFLRRKETECDELTEQEHLQAGLRLLSRRVPSLKEQILQLLHGTAEEDGL